MAPSPAGKLGFNFLKKVGRLFTGVKRQVNQLVGDWLNSPLSWRSIIWDNNIADEFPDHLMRTSRYLIGLTYVTHLINIALVGVFLVVDGVYSIYRNRFEVALTRQWTDDVPRVARSLLGVVLIVGAAGLF